jgi:hypothetical protein
LVNEIVVRENIHIIYHILEHIPLHVDVMWEDSV